MNNEGGRGFGNGTSTDTETPVYIYLMYNLFNDNYGLRLHLALFRQKSSIQEPEYDVKVRTDELSKMKFQLKLTIVG